MNKWLRDKIILYLYISVLVLVFIYLLAKPLILILNLCSLFGTFCKIFTDVFYNSALYSFLLGGLVFSSTKLIIGYVKRRKYLKGFHLYNHDNEKLNDIICGFEKNLEIYIKDTNEPIAFSAGILKKALYLSKGTIVSLEKDELKALICHEIAHILNDDVLHVAIARFVSDIFFYIPGLRSASNRWEAEKEYDADKIASFEASGSGSVVNALLRISSMHFAKSEFTAFSSGRTDVLNRINKLEGKKVRHKYNKHIIVVSIVTLFLVSILTVNASAAILDKGCPMHQPVKASHTCRL